MATLQDLQFPIDQAISAELLRCLPRTWVRATLIASRAAVQIEGSGQAGEATASHELETRVRELFVLNEQFKTDLAGIEFRDIEQRVQEFTKLMNRAREKVRDDLLLFD